MSSRTGPFVGGPSPRSAESLLDQIAESALDDDYYLVRAGRARRGWLSLLLVGVCVAALSATITVAAVQARSTRPAGEIERQSLASDIEARRDTLAERQATADRLSAEVEKLRAAGSRTGGLSDDVRAATAESGAEGSGLVLSIYPSTQDNLDGRVTASDLQILVNGLWYAGAEAISVDGRRLGALSSIRPFDGGITIDYRRIDPPYTVVALGDGDQLKTKFEAAPSGQYWRQRTDGTDVTLSMAPSSELEVPAAPTQRTSTDHATALKEDDR